MTFRPAGKEPGKRSKIFSKYFPRDDRNIANCASAGALKTTAALCFAFIKPSRFCLLNNTSRVAAHDHFQSCACKFLVPFNREILPRGHSSSHQPSKAIAHLALVQAKNTCKYFLWRGNGRTLKFYRIFRWIQDSRQGAWKLWKL